MLISFFLDVLHIQSSSSESVVSTEESKIGEEPAPSSPLPLSLPEEGDEESDLSPALVIAIREGKLSLNHGSKVRFQPFKCFCYLLIMLNFLFASNKQ
jgi:hypothetical protein